ncbi:hypothetical protein TNCV_4300041 [Trichonephila clavipes]|nr:hypothetical protein TNCV_4300041 [Trichonephila clavipes]
MNYSPNLEILIPENSNQVESAAVFTKGPISCQGTTGMKNGWRLQGKNLQPEQLVFEAGVSLFTDPISDFDLAIHQNDHQARRRFAEWAQNEIAVVPDFHKRNLFSDEAHFWLNGYVNKQNCRIWSEANPQVYVETPLHPEKLTVWCALWAGESFFKTMKATTLQ